MNETTNTLNIQLREELTVHHLLVTVGTALCTESAYFFLLLFRRIPLFQLGTIWKTDATLWKTSFLWAADDTLHNSLLSAA